MTLKRIRITVGAAILLVLICGAAGCGKKGAPVPKYPFQHHETGR